jgi:hypothetical protein
MVPPAAKGQREWQARWAAAPCRRLRHSPRLRAGRRRRLWDCHKLQRHGYGLVKNPEGFILDDAYGPLRAGEIERAKEWGAQLVRASVGKEDGWAIWDKWDSGSGE